MTSCSGTISPAFFCREAGFCNAHFGEVRSAAAPFTNTVNTSSSSLSLHYSLVSFKARKAFVQRAWPSQGCQGSRRWHLRQECLGAGHSGGNDAGRKDRNAGDQVPPNSADAQPSHDGLHSLDTSDCDSIASTSGQHPRSGTQQSFSTNESFSGLESFSANGAESGGEVAEPSGKRGSEAEDTSEGMVQNDLDSSASDAGRDEAGDGGFPMGLLYARIQEVEEKEELNKRQIADNWRSARCEQEVVAVLEDGVRRLKFHGDTLACGTLQGPVVTFRMTDAKKLAQYVGHQSEITCIDYDGTHVVAGSRDSVFYVWVDQSESRPGSSDVEPLHCFRGHQQGITHVQLCGEWVVSASLDGTIRIWSIASGRCLQTLEAGSPVRCFHRVRDYLIAGLESGEIRAFETQTGKSIFSFQGHTGAIRCLQYDETAFRLVTGSLDGQLKCWDLWHGHRLWKATHKAAAAFVAVQLDDSKVVVAANDGQVGVVDVESGAQLYTITGRTASIGSLQFDSTRLISDGRDNIVVGLDFSP